MQNSSLFFVLRAKFFMSSFEIQQKNKENFICIRFKLLINEARLNDFRKRQFVVCRMNTSCLAVESHVLARPICVQNVGCGGETKETREACIT